jgi:hypothetical protein
MAAAAFITTINFFDSSDTAAALRALGLRIQPEQIDVFPNDKLLREPRGDIRRDPTDAGSGPFSSHGVAVLLHEQLDGIIHLCGCIRELAGIGQHQSDLDRILCGGRRRHECTECNRGTLLCAFLLRVLLALLHELIFRCPNQRLPVAANRFRPAGVLLALVDGSGLGCAREWFAIFAQ